MFSTIIAVVLLLVAVVAVSFSFKFGKVIKAKTAADKTEDRYGRKYDPSNDRFSRLVWAGVAAVTAIGAAVIIFFSSFYTNGQGEAKVVLNFDGTVAGAIVQPGSGFKAPWQNFSDWDLFSQEAVYAGNKDGAPEYTGGKINGGEVTASVANGAQANLDVSVIYSIDADKVEDLYKQYRSQENFTKQIVEKSILSEIREVPSQYSAVEFRGEKKGEATQKILGNISKALEPTGVKVNFVNVQDVRYTEEVEKALKDVEVSNQNVQKQEAELRAAEVSAQQKVVTAQAEAEANRLLSESLTPQIIQQRLIDAYKAGTVFVVPEGTNPLIQVPSGK